MKTIHTRSNDGTRLRLGQWNPNGSRNILLVPGLAEHLDRYHHVAEFLVSKGYRVTLVELRGHGQSQGKRGHLDMWIRYVEDIQAALGTVAQPTVIVAHSMGGLATLSTMMHALHPTVLGVALSNPLLGLVQPPSAVVLSLSRLFSRFYPSFKLRKETNPELISRDPTVVAAYRSDPNIFRFVTARWGREALKALQDVHAYAPKYTQRMLLMISDGDHICDPEQAKQFAQNYGGSLQLEEFPKLYHELFNEPEKQLVFETLANWLESIYNDNQIPAHHAP